MNIVNKTIILTDEDREVGRGDRQPSRFSFGLSTQQMNKAANIIFIDNDDNIIVFKNKHSIKK